MLLILSPPFLKYICPVMYLPLSVKVANVKPVARLYHIPLSNLMYLYFYNHITWRKVLLRDFHIDTALKIRYEILRRGDP